MPPKASSRPRRSGNARTTSSSAVVIDGLSNDAVTAAMKAGLKAVLDVGPSKGVTRISAGNYGGKLGQFHYHLRELLP